jgi:hypothetical protein
MNIAHYWADGAGTMTPAGHSISMLNQIITNEASNLEVAAIAYAKLGIALSDAFLACWKTKFIYNLCRPVTYIRSYIDTSWLPFIGTPPFPEYPSGHSSQSGAMAQVMTDLFGNNYAFTDHTWGTSFGGPRSFDSFDEAAEEAAISRMYGGIHFEFGNNAGLALGTIVGQNVNELFEQLNVATTDPKNVVALNIFPNPVNDHVTIQLREDIAGSNYKIIDLGGKEMSSGSLSGPATILDMSFLSPGSYFLQTEEGATYKLVKN